MTQEENIKKLIDLATEEEIPLNVEVPIPFDSEIPIGDVHWKIFSSVVGKTEDGAIVELKWGWGAAYTEEELNKLADTDVPTEAYSVLTTLEMAIALRDDLSKIIAEQVGLECEKLALQWHKETSYL